jgi:DNA-binding response OmpR family regulator
MKKILLIDDEPELTELVKLRLENQGYEVLVANDGISGLSLAREHNPDLIILDVMLPGLDGYKICRLIKFDEKHKHIPVMVFTARVGEDDQKLSRQMGADAYLPKPFEPNIFLKKVKELLKDK